MKELKEEKTRIEKRKLRKGSQTSGLNYQMYIWTRIQRGGLKRMVGKGPERETRGVGGKRT